MADWVLLVDEATSSSYYANLSTRETSWRLPPELGGPLDEPLVPLGDEAAVEDPVPRALAVGDRPEGARAVPHLLVVCP